jgi:hypothetical protein
MSSRQARQAKRQIDEAWLNRPIGLALPSNRASAFNVMKVSTAPTPNPFRDAERRQQDTSRTPTNSEAAMTCYRCATILPPGASVCTSCCATSDGAAPAPVQVEAGQLPEIAEPDHDAVAPEAVSRILASWPFGASDATNVLARVPAQRAESESAASIAPNPFRAPVNG